VFVIVVDRMLMIKFGYMVMNLGMCELIVLVSVYVMLYDILNGCMIMGIGCGDFVCWYIG